MPKSSLILKLSAVAAAIALVVIGGTGLLSVYAGPAAQVTVVVTLPPVVNTLLPGPTSVPPTAGSGSGPTAVAPTAGSGGSGANTTTTGNTAPTAANGATAVPNNGSSFSNLICIPMDLVDANATMPATMDASMESTMNASMDAAMASNPVYLGITVRQTAACGSQIVEVEDSSPASAASLQLNDVIVAVNTTATPSVDDLLEAIESHKSGDVVTLTITRNKALISVKVTLEANPMMGASMGATMGASMGATMDASMEGTMEPTEGFVNTSM